MSSQIQIVECPRDAMQGWKRHIPTEEKVAYLNTLLATGFDVLDFGSFVSPKAIPQLADTAEVLAALDPSPTPLLAIVANLRGAETAASFGRISSLGFPLSASETFQHRNTNLSIAQATEVVGQMQRVASDAGKELVVYISMAFGNPYGDPYSAEAVLEQSKALEGMGVRCIALSDTVGLADPETIRYLFSTLVPGLPQTVFGAHFHATPDNWRPKVQAAYEAGCRRFDSALNGIGGCPMAKDELVGNLATENLLRWADEQHISPSLDRAALDEALRQAASIFS